MFIEIKLLIDISDKNLAGMIFENLEEKLGALRIVSCLNPIEGWGTQCKIGQKQILGEKQELASILSFPGLLDSIQWIPTYEGVFLFLSSLKLNL